MDLTARSVVARTVTEWDDDLPLIAPPFLLLVRKGRDVVGLDLERDGLRTRGQVAKAADDIWVPLAWAPASAEEVVVAAATDTLGDAGRLCRRRLGPAILPAGEQLAKSRPGPGNSPRRSRPPASRPASLTRPMPTTYIVSSWARSATREQADSASRSLGMPSFVISGPGTPAP